MEPKIEHELLNGIHKFVVVDNLQYRGVVHDLGFVVVGIVEVGPCALVVDMQSKGRKGKLVGIDDNRFVGNIGYIELVVYFELVYSGSFVGEVGLGKYFSVDVVVVVVDKVGLALQEVAWSVVASLGGKLGIVFVVAEFVVA